MQKMLQAWLFNEFTVVIDKRQIINATDSEFREISLIVPHQDIKEWNKEVERMELDAK